MQTLEVQFGHRKPGIYITRIIIIQHAFALNAGVDMKISYQQGTDIEMNIKLKNFPNTRID